MCNFHWPCMALVSWHCYIGKTGKEFHDMMIHWHNWKRVSWHCYTGKTGKKFHDMMLHWQNWKRVSWHCYTGKTEKGFLDTITLAKQKKGFMTLLVLHWQNWKRFSWHCYTGKTGKGFYDIVTLARLGNVDRVNLNEDHFTDNKEYWGCTCGSCHLGLLKLFCLQLHINVYQRTLFQR